MKFPMVPLGHVCQVNPRATKTNHTKDILVSFVSMSAIDERLGVITNSDDRPISKVSTGCTSFEDGDILFAKITPCMENGKIVLVRSLTNGIGRGSTEFHVLRPGNSVLGEYIYHTVRQSWFRDHAKMSFTGTTGYKRVPKSFMKSVMIPVPPLVEQRRIVHIFDHIDKHVAEIERLQTRTRECLREINSSVYNVWSVHE